MQDYKASYILAKSEILFLLSSVPAKQPTQPVLYAINEYLRHSVPTQDTVESLVGKKLARKDAGSISVEPVVDLLAKSALSAMSLWEVRSADSEVAAVILRSEALFLLITRYIHIEDNWKVTPFQDSTKLLADLGVMQVSGITRIDCDGNTRNYAALNELFKGEV